MVFNYHLYMIYYKQVVTFAYGVDPPFNNQALQLPFLKLIFAGRGAVCIFFTLSGYVLTYSFLRKVSSGADSEKLLSDLCSSVFRRPFRLFAPMMAMVLITTPFSYAFPYYILPIEWFTTFPAYNIGVLYPYPPFLEHVWNHIVWTIPVMNPFTWDLYWVPGVLQCWTLAVEFRGSLIIFLLCLASWRLHRRSRKIMLVSFAAVAQANMRYDMFCFTMGMLLADLRHNPLAKDFEPILKRIHPGIQSFMKNIIMVTLLLVSLIFLGWPDYRWQGVGPYKYFGWMTWGVYSNNEYPGTPFYFASFGAFGLILALEDMKWLQTVFATVVMRYMGEISFGFYLLHWLWIKIAGAMWYKYLFEQHGWPREHWFFTVYLISIGLTFWSADLFWRIIDENVVKFSRTLSICLGIGETRNPALPYHRPGGQEEVPFLPPSQQKDGASYIPLEQVTVVEELFADDPYKDEQPSTEETSEAQTEEQVEAGPSNR